VHPFAVDASKFEAAFGRPGPTRHPDAVQQTVPWYRPRWPQDSADKRSAPTPAATAAATRRHPSAQNPQLRMPLILISGKQASEQNGESARCYLQAGHGAESLSVIDGP